MTLTRAQIGFVKGIGLVLLTGVVGYLANAANLNGVVSGGTALIIAGIASSIESYMQAKGSGGLFGAVSVKGQQ